MPEHRYLLGPDGPGENLLIFQKAGSQLLVPDFLDRQVLIDGHACCRRRGLTKNHENRFHSDAAICNVRSGKANRHEQVLAFGRPGNN